MARSIVVPRDKFFVRGRSRGGEEKEKNRRRGETKVIKSSSKKNYAPLIFVLLQPIQLSSVANVVNWMPHASFCVVQHAKLLVPGQTVGSFSGLDICPFALVLLRRSSKLKMPKSVTVWIQISP